MGTTHVAKVGGFFKVLKLRLVSNWEFLMSGEETFEVGKFKVWPSPLPRAVCALRLPVSIFYFSKKIFISKTFFDSSLVMIVLRGQTSLRKTSVVKFIKSNNLRITLKKK